MKFGITNYFLYINTMKNEIWKDIPGYEGLYQVSDQGRVRSLNYHREGKTKLLTLTINKNGYVYVHIRYNGINKNFRVHRLVAEAFLGPSDLQINHKNENKQDNRLINIEYVSASYNMKYGTRSIRALQTHKKNNSPTAEKAVVQVSLDNIPIKIYKSIHETGLYGFEYKNVFKCCKGERNTHKGFKWLFYYPPIEIKKPTQIE